MQENRYAIVNKPMRHSFRHRDIWQHSCHKSPGLDPQAFLLFWDTCQVIYLFMDITMCGFLKNCIISVNAFSWRI